ncbi:MAG TPA: MFS transporter [Cyclobacteriaceae bacterium]|nr:MFS transporter [Cyclobacteriaceae bacterium]
MSPSRLAVKIIFFLNGFIYASWVSRLPRIQDIYQLNNASIGIMLLSAAVGAVVAMPFTGWLIVQNGSRRITLVSVVLFCIFVPFIPLMPGYEALIALYFFMGISTGMLDVAMNAQAVMVEQQYGRPIMTSFHALFSIGMMLGALGGSLFVKLSPNLLLHLSAITTAGLLGIFWARYRLITDKPAEAPEGPAFRLPSQALVGIGLIAFCCMLGEGSMADWSTNYMEKIVKAERTIAPFGLSAFAAAMTLGRTFGDKARAKFGDKKLLVISSLVATAGLLLSLLFLNALVTIVGFFVVGLGLSVIVPIAYSIAGNMKGLSPGVGLAMVTTVGYTGFLFGPPIIGFVADWQTLRIALAFVVLLFTLMTILALRYQPHHGDTA